MLRKTLLLTLIVSVLSSVGWHPAYAGSREEAAIRALIDRWTKAAQEKNVDGVMSIYQRGPSLVAYDLVPPLQYKGWDAYRADYKAFFDQYDGPIEFEFRDLVIAADATFGYSHELQRVSGTLKDGKKAAFWLRVTDVYRKIGASGAWFTSMYPCRRT
jgi:ketosteroid isomerase-like protein